MSIEVSKGTFSAKFLDSCSQLLEALDRATIEKAALALAQLRQRNGRLFLVGSGGGAGHASHATCDFRKLCGIEAYAPYDNVSELTARVNDDGWDSTLSRWLEVSRLSQQDGLFVFSVGGGSKEKSVSVNLVKAIEYARSRGTTVFGIVGRDGGYTAQVGDHVIIIPPVVSELVTPLTEGFQAVIWHLLVSHPELQLCQAKWESVCSEADSKKGVQQ